MKAHRSTFIDLDYSYVRSQSQTSYDSIVGVQEKIQQKLEDSFENQDKRLQSGFDIGKLEQIKEKTNKNFFDKMETLKSSKRGAKGEQASKGGDLLDLDAVGENKPQGGNNDDDDLFGLDLGTAKKPQPQSSHQQKSDPYGGLDLLDSDVQPVKRPDPHPQSQGNDLMFDFQQNLNINKHAPNNGGGLIDDDDMFGDIGTGMRSEEAKNKVDSKPKGQGADPFDFLAF